MKFDYEAGDFWAMIFLYAYTLAQSVWLFFTRRHKAVLNRMETLETSLNARINGMDGEIRRICLDVAHLPDQRQIEKLNDTMADLSDQISKLEGRFDGVNRAVDLINEFLINQGKSAQ